MELCNLYIWSPRIPKAQRASAIGHCGEALHAATHGVDHANHPWTLATREVFFDFDRRVGLHDLKNFQSAMSSFTDHGVLLCATLTKVGQTRDVNHGVEFRVSWLLAL